MIWQRGHLPTVRTRRTVYALLISLSFVVFGFRDSANAQAILRTLHSFGFAPGAAADPHARVTEGSDGILYGTTTRGGPAGGGTIFRVGQDGTGFEVLHSFAGGVEGSRPRTPALEASDKRLYGVTERCGAQDAGVIWSMEKDGNDYRVLRSFRSDSTDGWAPSSLLEASDGVLYGATDQGGTGTAGTLFKLNKDGSGYAILRHFQRRSDDGRGPFGEMLEGTDGWLYGVTYDGGTLDRGTVYRVQKNGTAFALLHRFGDLDGDGARPAGGVLEGPDGLLYGTASNGGGGGGVVFRLARDGSQYQLLHIFSGTPDGDGWICQSKLALAADGMLWGTTALGGTAGLGTIFKLSRDGSDYAVVHPFAGPDGSSVADGLILGSSGRLYGVALSGGRADQGTFFQLDPLSGEFAVLRHFQGLGGDGSVGVGGLCDATNGLLYGTCSSGGDYNQGMVFSLGRGGAGYSILHHFSGSAGDGAAPSGGLFMSAAGVAYGMTQSGGSNGLGMIFRLSDAGNAIGLHHFSTADGQQPVGRPVVDAQGNLYGLTKAGGAAGGGICFRLNLLSGEFTRLHEFGSIAGDGRQPAIGPTVGNDGWLYGSTRRGGSKGFGSLFKLNPATREYVILHHFAAVPGDGRSPEGELLFDGDGLLYGTTVEGGGTNAGTLFSINPDGSGYSLLRSFGAAAKDGRNPSGSLLAGTNGWLYGTTRAGGTDGLGTVYACQRNGSSLTILQSMSDRSIGLSPNAGLFQGSDGNMYAAFAGGGEFGAGTLVQIPFWLSVSTELNSASATATFTVTSGGAPALSYAWLWDGNLLEGQTNSALVLTHVTRYMNGIYAVTVSSVAGTLLSSNVVLHHRSPQIMQVLSHTNGAVQIRSMDADGGDLTAADLPNLTLQATLNYPIGPWLNLTRSITLENGAITFEVPLDARIARLVWRIIEK